MAYKETYIQGDVADGTFESTDIPEYLKDHYFVIFFYDKFGSIVTPSAGQVTFTATDDGHNYGSLFNGSFAANHSSYNRVSAAGKLVRAKVTLAGIVGATKFKVEIASYS